jgi:hypothetical protein
MAESASTADGRQPARGDQFIERNPAAEVQPRGRFLVGRRICANRPPFPIVTPLLRLHQWIVVTGGVLAISSALTVAEVQGGDDTAAQLWGRWLFVKERSDATGAAATTAAKDLPFIVRPIARARLYAALKPYQWVELARSGDQVQITTNDWPAICTNCAGMKIPWMRPDGKKQQVSTSLSGEVLTQTFSGKEGTYTNEYSLESGGFLLVRVTLTSPMMKTPVTYVLRYRQAPG